MRLSVLLSTLAEGLLWEKFLGKLRGFVCYVHNLLPKYRLWERYLFSKSTSENAIVSDYACIPVSPHSSCLYSDLTERIKDAWHF